MKWNTQKKREKQKKKTQKKKKQSHKVNIEIMIYCSILNLAMDAYNDDTEIVSYRFRRINSIEQ